MYWCTYSDWSDPINGTLSQQSVTVAHRFRGDLVSGDRVLPEPYYGFEFELSPDSFAEETQLVNPNWTRWGRSTQSRRTGSWACASSNRYHAFDSGGLPYVPTGVTDSSTAAVLSRVRQDKMDLSETLGGVILESDKMYRDAKSMFLAISAAWRRDWSAVARHLGVNRGISTVDTVLDGWLAFKFGWKPLLEDITSARQNILDAMSSDDSYATVIGASNRQASPITKVLGEEVTGNLDYVVETKLWYRVSDDSVQGLQQLGLTNPIETAWNLIPYSFVIDWVTGTGNFLSSLSSSHGLDFVRGYRLKISRQNITVKGPTMSYTNSYRPSCNCQGKAFTRSVLASWPHPSPRIRFGLDSNKALTLLALANQRA